MKPAIPLYTAEGELYDWISEQRMDRLDRLGQIQIIRHKKGRVARCFLLRRLEDPKPVRLTSYLGKRYSFRERLDNGRCCWSLRRLDQGDGLVPTPNGELNFAH